MECVLGSTRVPCGQDVSAYRSLMDELAKVQFGAVDPTGEAKCRKQARGGDMLEIFVTTAGDVLQSNQRQRVILVSPEQQDGAAHVCPWLTVPGDGNWSQRLPRLWKSACHAA